MDWAHGGAKTELLIAVKRIAEQFGMTAELVESDHHLNITTTKAQRTALWEFNEAARLNSARVPNRKKSP